MTGAGGPSCSAESPSPERRVGVERAGVSPPVHGSASGSSPPPLSDQVRAGFVEPAAPGKAVAGAVLGGWSGGAAVGRALAPGSAGVPAAAPEGAEWEAKGSWAVGLRPVGWIAVPGLGLLGGGGPSCRGGSVEARVGKGLSREGLAAAGTRVAVAVAVAVAGAPGSSGGVSGAGVPVTSGAAGGEGVGTSSAEGSGERSGL